MIVPLLVGLGLLAEPTVRLLFEWGQFTAHDSAQVVSALHVYLVGGLFAAIDFPLIYAFYARNDTLLPALVGVLSVVVYAVAALVLIGGLGFLGLVWADTAKQGAHAVVMLGLLYWKLGLGSEKRRSDAAQEELGPRPLQGIRQTVRSVATVCGAAVAMAIVMMWLLSLLDPGGTTTLSNDILRMVVCGSGGALAYSGVLLLAGQPEAGSLPRSLFVWSVAPSEGECGLIASQVFPRVLRKDLSYADGGPSKSALVSLCFPLIHKNSTSI